MYTYANQMVVSSLQNFQLKFLCIFLLPVFATYFSHPVDVIIPTHENQLTCQQTPSDAFLQNPLMQTYS
jgi:hypothetical protein